MGVKKFVVDLEQALINGECLFAVRDRVAAHEKAPWWRRFYNVLFTGIRDDQKKLAIVYDALCPDAALEYQDHRTMAWKKKVKITKILPETTRFYHPILSRMKLFAQRYFNLRKAQKKAPPFVGNLDLHAFAAAPLSKEKAHYDELDRNITYQAQKNLKLLYVNAHTDILKIIKNDSLSPTDRGELIRKIENALDSEVGKLRFRYQEKNWAPNPRGGLENEDTLKNEFLKLNEEFDYHQCQFIKSFEALKLKHQYSLNDSSYYFSLNAQVMILRTKDLIMRKYDFSNVTMREHFIVKAEENIKESEKEFPAVERKEAVSVLQSILNYFRAAFISSHRQEEITMRQSMERLYQDAIGYLTDIFANPMYSKIACDFLGARVCITIIANTKERLDTHFLKLGSELGGEGYKFLSEELERIHGNLLDFYVTSVNEKMIAEDRLPVELLEAEQKISAIYLEEVEKMLQDIAVADRDQLILSFNQRVENDAENIRSIIDKRPEFKLTLENLVRGWNEVVSTTVKKSYNTNLLILEHFEAEKKYLLETHNNDGRFSERKKRRQESCVRLSNEVREILQQFFRDNSFVGKPDKERLDSVRIECSRRLERMCGDINLEEVVKFKKEIEAIYAAIELGKSNETIGSITEKCFALLKEREPENTPIYYELFDCIQNQDKKARFRLSIVNIYDNTIRALEPCIFQDELSVEESHSLLNKNLSICLSLIQEVQKAMGFLDLAEGQFLTDQKKRLDPILLAHNIKSSFFGFFSHFMGRVELTRKNKNPSYEAARTNRGLALQNFKEVVAEHFSKHQSENFGGKTLYEEKLRAISESYAERISQKNRELENEDRLLIEAQIRRNYEEMDPTLDEGGVRWIQGEAVRAKCEALIESNYEPGETRVALLEFLNEVNLEMQYRRPHRKVLNVIYVSEKIDDDEKQEFHLMEEIGLDGTKLRNLIVEQEKAFPNKFYDERTRMAALEPLVKEYRRLAKKYHTDKNTTGPNTTRMYERIIIWLNAFNEKLKLIQRGEATNFNSLYAFFEWQKLSEIIYYVPTVILEALDQHLKRQKEWKREAEERERLERKAEEVTNVLGEKLYRLFEQLREYREHQVIGATYPLTLDQIQNGLNRLEKEAVKARDWLFPKEKHITTNKLQAHDPERFAAPEDHEDPFNIFREFLNKVKKEEAEQKAEEESFRQILAQTIAHRENIERLCANKNEDGPHQKEREQLINKLKQELGDLEEKTKLAKELVFPQEDQTARADKSEELNPDPKKPLSRDDDNPFKFFRAPQKAAAFAKVDNAHADFKK
jgi:hypothetical protein